MLFSFLSVPLLAMLLTGGPAPKPTPARCSYPNLPPATRQFLRRIDQTLPPLVAQLRQSDPKYPTPYIEFDSCFHAVVLPRLFAPGVAGRMHRGLHQMYYKEMGEHAPIDPQAASLLVLAYDSEAAATAAEQLQDSLRLDLQRRCRGRIRELEPCSGLARYDFTRAGSHLLHYSLYSQDPMQQAWLRSLASALTSELLVAPTPPPPRARPRR